MYLRVGAECGGKSSLSSPPVKGFGIQLAGNFRCRSNRPSERQIEVPVAVPVPSGDHLRHTVCRGAMDFKSLGISTIATRYTNDR